VAVVLAINAGGTGGEAFDRLTTELDGHDVVVVTSSQEALAQLGASTPDLVVFPVSWSASEREPVVQRLRQLSDFGDAQQRLFDALAAEESTPSDSRWFYWFKPQAAAPVETPGDPAASQVKSAVALAGGWGAGAAGAVASAARTAAGSLSSAREPIVRWAPRIAAVAVLAVAGVAGRSYWTTARPALTAIVARHAPDANVGAKVDATKEKPGAPQRTTGSLTVTSEPSGAAVIFGGKQRGVTPITIDGLAPGTHAFVIQSEAGTVRRSVAVKANETSTLDVSIYAGFLAVFSPIELEITEQGRIVRLDDQSQALLPPGRHELVLANPELGYRETRTVEILPGERTALSLTTPQSTLSVTATPAAEVWVDGTRLGDAPLANVPIDLGTHEIVLKHPQHGERHVTVRATTAPVHINVDMTAR
jgi:hypothetical protein